MTGQSLFDDKQTTPNSDASQQTTPPVESVTPASSDPSLEDLLGGIKNESGERKYDSVPKALEGLKHAQEYIPQLKQEVTAKDQELAQLREELAKRESVEDVVERLTAQQSNNSTPASEGLDEQKVATLVQGILQRNNQETIQATNFQSVNQALLEKFGDAEAAKKAIAAKAAELGMSVSDIGELAKKAPKAALAYFGAQGSPDIKQTSSSVNTTSFQKAPPVEDIPRPEKSLLAGATSKEQAAYMAKIKEKVYADLGVTQ